ncbi:pyruvate dehydrogenase (acetyl-transferring) E1 component subunit alpha [Microterricola viridarii]|uniref:Pyruvate dehydrogenase (Acetyl-transferring) E1 component subunit alpha n=1 Tax=Microterricola viridarii TaxID=412690 RepID=A0A0X8E1H4_9MICO|nr:pyruvate dehydrogenase (acetyl-transferring) E1 component subunit alpha [Microterricola viridarii]AMB58600.1 pyruvate dehydrogenase (acetyl-transferring) E1 component subunit alpha [Microterricola viridarii]
MSNDVLVPAPPTLPTHKPIRLIDETGRAVTGTQTAGFRMPDTDTLLSLYRRMVLARRFEAQVTALTRQGRLATYPSALGQEACEIASVAALAQQDWLFPTYRDTIALLTRGVSPVEILSFFRGDWHTGFDPHAHRISPQSTPLATQALHAVGLATAAKLKQDDTVALTFLGDGSTSEGDAHEAFNFASVWQAPVVFVIQNNQYAISVPYSKQSRARTLADRAIGYGMPGYYVDGNDVAAMYAVVTAAVERARAGHGPTLIEGLTYRMEAHTNSDDPTRYRETSETAGWLDHDPIDRVEKHLDRAGALTTAVRASIAAEAEALATATRDAMNETPVLDPLEVFDHVYSAARPALLEQRAFLANELAHTDTREAGAA